MSKRSSMSCTKTTISRHSENINTKTWTLENCSIWKSAHMLSYDLINIQCLFNKSKFDPKVSKASSSPTGLFKGIHPELPNSSSVTKQTHTPPEFGLVIYCANNSHPKERQGVCACRATRRSAKPKKHLCCIICVILIWTQKASFSMGCYVVFL